MEQGVGRSNSRKEDIKIVMDCKDTRHMRNIRASRNTSSSHSSSNNHTSTTLSTMRNRNRNRNRRFSSQQSNNTIRKTTRAQRNQLSLHNSTTLNIIAPQRHMAISQRSRVPQADQ
jgi:hypothetical protein